MHEMAVCSEVVDLVLAEAREVNAISVNEVQLVLGEVRDIVEDLFDGFFHYLTRGTIAENAALVFTRVPVTAECQECGQVFPMDVKSRKMYECPQCHGQNYEIKSGMEFFLGSIDVTTKEELCAKNA